MYYSICRSCGAHLDPCEQCDCTKKAAADAANIDDGKAEALTTHSASQFT